MVWLILSPLAAVRIIAIWGATWHLYENTLLSNLFGSSMITSFSQGNASSHCFLKCVRVLIAMSMAISLAAAVLSVRGLLTAACNRKHFLLEVGKMDEQGFKIKIQQPVGNSNQSREKLQSIFCLSDWLICAVNCTNYVTKFQARYYDDMINSSFCFSVFWQRAIILADTKIYSSYWCSGGSRCFTVSRS